MSLRKSVFSGSWYPSDRQACEDQIRQFLAAGIGQSPTIANPVGGIVPHVGLGMTKPGGCIPRVLCVGL